MATQPKFDGGSPKKKYYTIASLVCGCRVRTRYDNGRPAHTWLARKRGCERSHAFLKALVAHWKARHPHDG